MVRKWAHTFILILKFKTSKKDDSEKIREIQTNFLQFETKKKTMRKKTLIGRN